MKLRLPRKNLPGVIYWHGNTGSRQIALTFDDGPNEPYTSQILDILAKHKIKATFFMVGKNVKRSPETVRKIVKEGHAIGNHTYSHRGQLLDTAPRAGKEIQLAETAIKEAAAAPLYLFRPPYGRTNRWALRQAERLGYIICQWSVNAGDWKGTNAERIKKKVLAGAESGAIILMHDGGNLVAGKNRSATVIALPGIILSLRSRGYNFVTIPKLLELEERGQR